MGDIVIGTIQLLYVIICALNKNNKINGKAILHKNAIPLIWNCIFVFTCGISIIWADNVELVYQIIPQLYMRFCLILFISSFFKSKKDITYLFNILLLNRFFNIPFVDGAHWYLGVLLSATTILIVLDLLKLKNNPVAYLVWIGLEILVDFCGIFKEAYILGGPFVGCICIGISIRAMYENSIGGGQNKNTGGWIIVILSSLMYTVWARGVVCTLEILIVAPVFILTIFEKAKIFDFKVFRKLGENSYPVYLIHQNVGFMLEWLLIEHFNGWNYFIPTTVFIISLAIGTIIFYLVERPIQKWIKG